MDKERQTLEQWIENAQNIVFFGGAGVSTESGIPDFRSVDGLYNQKYPWPPEEILSRDFFFSNTEEFYRFYRDKLIVHAKPNPAHLRLARLEKQGKLLAVITQNIDGLHTAAGSKRVYELHGSQIKAARRVDRDQEAGLALYLTGEYHLLDIASGKRSGSRADTRAPDIKVLHELLRVHVDILPAQDGM